MRHIGMAPNRPGRGARRIEQDGVDRMIRPPGQRIGGNRLDPQLQPVEIGHQPIEAAGRAIDRGHLRAGIGELCGLAAGRGAKIDDLPALDAPAPNAIEQPHRHRRGGVLDPPRPLGITRQRHHRAARGPAQRAGRQFGRLQLFLPGFLIGAHRQIERRLLQVSGGNRARDLVAIGAAPRPPQPFRRIEAGRILALDPAAAFDA